MWSAMSTTQAMGPVRPCATVESFTSQFIAALGSRLLDRFKHAYADGEESLRTRLRAALNVSQRQHVIAGCSRSSRLRPRP